MSRNKQPDITVVTPSLPERRDMLSEACQSVEAQALKPVAHLIGVDHARRGPGATLNRLISAVDTEWVSILADDDLYDPNYLEVLARKAHGADVILAWCRIEGSPERQAEQYRGEFSPFKLVRKEDTGMRGTFMFRKSLWETLGYPIGFCEDWQFLVNCAEYHARFAPVYRELWTYRFHGGNASVALS